MEFMDRGIKINRSNLETYNNMIWDRIEELEKENEELKEHNEKLTELVEEKDNTVKELVKELDTSEDEVLRLENKISDMKCEGLNK